MASSTRDRELGRLFLAELERHADSLRPETDPETVRRALHALKGSAGIAGERGLFDALARIERRIANGDDRAVEQARAIVAKARAALERGEPVPIPPWPIPPEDLAAQPIDPEILDRYVAEAQDRLLRLDQALASDDPEAAAAAYREVHAMKSAALAAGDEVVAWFCHGLEDRLRDHADPRAAQRALDEAARWRGVLGEMLVAPDRALESLRRTTGHPSTAPPPSAGAFGLPPPRPPFDSDLDLRSSIEEATLRVRAAVLDRLDERLRQLAEARGVVSAGAALVHGDASRARAIRALLADALRAIGPPRPWGAPAAALRTIEQAARELGRLADELESGATRLVEAADQMRAETAAAHADLAATRNTTLSGLFERVASLVRAQARRDAVEVRIVMRGGETAVDRRLADALFDPVLQLARNAVAHGVEDLDARLARGKPPVGTVLLSAQARAGGLEVRVEDDGAGVDVARVRQRAMASGVIPPEMARDADDDTLLALLFLPGFTTRDSADLLAGRGVGLDLTLEAVRRLGGTIRLASQAGAGFSAIIDVPIEPGVVRVLWLHAASGTYALPVRDVGRVALARDVPRASIVPLAACLGRPAVEDESDVVVELAAPPDDAPVALSVARVGTIEEVVLRRVPPLVLRAGPYAGAILRSDGLHMCLDAHALAARRRGRPAAPARG